MVSPSWALASSGVGVDCAKARVETKVRRQRRAVLVIETVYRMRDGSGWVLRSCVAAAMGLERKDQLALRLARLEGGVRLGDLLYREDLDRHFLDAPGAGPVQHADHGLVCQVELLEQ